MKRNLFIPGALLVGATILFAADVTTDYSHSIDFGNFHTYSWLKVDAGNSLWADRIQRDVNAELMEKGWMEVPSGGQAAVSAFGSRHDQQSLQTFYDGFGGGWRWGGFGDIATTTPINTPIGTLVVDVFDAQNKQLIWRGTAQKTLSGSPEKNEKKLADEVKDMFKHFPPPPKS